jgi:hypothetical protein
VSIREVYLAACSASLELLSFAEVGAKWADESALPEFSVRGLAGHLARSILQVEMFLDSEEPDGPTITAVTYYADLVGVTDRESELNVGVRARGEEVAVSGHVALVDQTTRCLGRLRERLPREPAGRRVSAFGRALVLDEYLQTRLVETAVHIDDLSLSVGLEPPEVPARAYDAAIGVLLGVARRRQGDRAVLRALTRRERDDVEALRVL